MATATSSTPAPAPPPPDADAALRLVLFGLPAAGKSSLLGALGQSAASQEHLLGGKLVDRSAGAPHGGLAELRRRVYEDTQRRTAEEVVPYPVRFEPAASPLQASDPAPADAVILDCDGRVASDMLVRKLDPGEAEGAGALAREVVQADTLILVVDASAPPNQVEADFAEFDRFLRQMERGRARRSDVAGLPVFLVLTKCDLLAQVGDSSADWMDRIETRKREVDARFREFLSRQQAEGGELPFGRLDLHVWATAVKRPPLSGSPPRPREPFGVAELFRQCLEEAGAYRRQVTRARGRLLWTFGVTLALVGALLVAGAGLVLLNRASRAGALTARVEDFRFLDRGGPAERLRGPLDDLLARQGKLTGIRNDPGFPLLADDLREFVQERLDEVEAYLPYLDRVQKELRAVAPTSIRELDERRDRLAKEFGPPRQEWAGTEAARDVKDALDEAAALRASALRLRDWYVDAYEGDGKLATLADYEGAEGGIDWADWGARVEKALDPARRPPLVKGEPVPGTVARFDEVRRAAADHDSRRAGLARLLDLGCALGLVPATKARPAVLSFGREVTLDVLRARVQELKAAYPDYDRTFTPGGLPEAALPAVRQAARSQYAVLLRPGRAEVLRQLRQAGKGNEETTARWAGVRAWLKDPGELAAWRVLATILARLDDPEAEDPVAALAAFLGRTRFTVEFKKAVLEIPDRHDARPRADARLRVLHPASDRQPALGLEPVGEPTRDLKRRVWVYTYRLSEGERIFYRPGEKLWAELPLRDDKQQLSWADSRSAQFQFERLRLPPRLLQLPAASLTDGRQLEGVHLLFSPEDGVPRVPDLVPEVKLD